jgi:branched-chain amino acid transport system ATP-binding protein
MLRVEGLSAGYGGFAVLRDVRLTVPDASVVALLGPNGAGKTTLLRVISGLLEPWAGRITFDGQDVTAFPAHRLGSAGLCHVPEGRGVFGPLTVRDNLTLFSPPGRERDGLERALDAFPTLKNRLDQVAGTMSGGQQQILALTRVYLSGARLILLDEVSMGLAPIIVDEIFTFLGRIAGEGVSLLLVEQYVSKALQIADYAYILSRGEVSFAGESAELADADVFSRYLGETAGSQRPLTEV